MGAQSRGQKLAAYQYRSKSRIIYFAFLPSIHKLSATTSDHHYELRTRKISATSYYERFYDFQRVATSATVYRRRSRTNIKNIFVILFHTRLCKEVE